MDDKCIKDFYALKNMLEEKTSDQLFNFCYRGFSVEYEKALIKQKKVFRFLYKKYFRKFYIFRKIRNLILKEELIVDKSILLDKRQYLYEFMLVYNPVLNPPNDRLKMIEELKIFIEDYNWLYERLVDNTSRNVLFNTLMYRITGKIMYLTAVLERKYDQYFDKDFMKCDENEVFVDCGGYIGDTVQKYVENYTKYKKIYIYEPSDENFKAATNTLKGQENVIFRKCGVSNSDEVLSFNNTNTAGSKFTENGGKQVAVVTIDKDISEKVTFIKMDIEGYELKALQGAIEHIKNDKPKLAICLYHLIDDMRKIPKFVDNLNPNYKFYLRNYDEIFGETILYAVV